MMKEYEVEARWLEAIKVVSGRKPGFRMIRPAGVVCDGSHNEAAKQTEKLKTLVTRHYLL